MTRHIIFYFYFSLIIFYFLFINTWNNQLISFINDDDQTLNLHLNVHFRFFIADNKTSQC